MLSGQTRPSAVAGSFYSNDKNELKADLQSYLQGAKKSTPKTIDAIIVPHAGYVFSAHTAAASYSTLNKKYKNIFLIGSSHHTHFEGASIFDGKSYSTPLGEVKINKELVKSLMQNKLFTYYKEAHTKEHTLEVQLPFLQNIYNDNLQIVPIILGTYELESIQQIAKILKPYFDKDENLFIISTDLSHYPTYEDANKIDKLTLDAIVKNNPLEFIDAIVKNENSNTKELFTSACGWSSLLTLLYMTQDNSYKYELLEYQNSGDTQYGDKNRVVGYGALRVYKDAGEFSLDEHEKKELLELAKLSLYEITLHHKKLQIDETKISPKLKKHLGAFVTLNKNGNLRGCIGRFEPNEPLYKVIIDMAIASAIHDTRFKQVSKDELENIDIEISVLTPRKQIYYLDEISLGKNGIYIESGLKSGTYLPHVATQMNWSKQEFVDSCAYDKAHLTKEEYKRAKFYTYDAIVFDKKKIQ